MNKQTLIVNLLGGPNSRKSTMAYNIAGQLKLLGANCELALEYAKDLVWEERHKTFENQIYLFGKQHQRIYRLVGQVDVIITDCPILLTPIYDAEKRKDLVSLVLNEYRKTLNYNVFLKRKKDNEYVQHGRIHNEEQAVEIDQKVKDFLNQYKIPYQELECNKENIDHVVRVVFEQMGWSNSF